MVFYTKYKLSRRTLFTLANFVPPSSVDVKSLCQLSEK